MICLNRERQFIFVKVYFPQCFFSSATSDFFKNYFEVFVMKFAQAAVSKVTGETVRERIALGIHGILKNIIFLK